jgi:uncharacterized protein YcfJ
MKRIERGMATALMVALASLLAACGGSDAPSKQTAAPTDASASAQPGKDAAPAPADAADTKSGQSADANPPPGSDKPASDKPIQSSYYARQPQPASGTAAPPADAAPAADAASAAPTPALAADAGARYANVISVQPVKQTSNAPHEECQDVRVVHRHKPKDDNQIAGTVIGAVAGGVIGHQVGGGRGRDLATVAGAVGGGIAGKKIQENQQNQRTYTTTERRCRKVSGPSEQVVAYDVVYEYLGSSHQVRLDHDPGDRVELPVRGIE